MSKGSLFWANASGKLGETVLYRSGGEQRTRTYVAKIKNPKTLAQMENRLSMLNLATTYRLLRPILEASFPDRKKNRSGFNEFVSLNKSVNTAVINQMMAQSNVVVPYNFLMSRGTWNPLGTFGYNAESEGYGYNVTSIFDTAYRKEVGEGITDSRSYPLNSKVKFDKFIEKAGLPVNTRVTLIVADYVDDGFALSYETLSSDSTTEEFAATKIGFNTGEMVIEEGMALPAEVQVNFGYTGSFTAERMICVILSYKDGNGKLQVSTSRMTLTSQSKEYVEQFLKGGDVYNQVLDTYGYNVGAAI